MVEKVCLYQDSDLAFSIRVTSWLQVNDILMTASHDGRMVEEHVSSYVSFLKEYRCIVARDRKCSRNTRGLLIAPFQEGKVLFGAWVEIENAKGHKIRIRIVGGEEIFERRDYISIDSPMAQALLKKEVGDEVIVQTPTMQMAWKVKKIEYEK